MYFMDVRDADDLWNFVHRKAPYDDIRTGTTLIVSVRDTDGLLVDIKVVANKAEFSDLNLYHVGVYFHKKKKPTVKKVYTHYYGCFSSQRIIYRRGSITMTPEPVPGLPENLAKGPLTFTLERREAE